MAEAADSTVVLDAGEYQRAMVRLRRLEEYRAGHETQIAAWWEQQWATNADHETRMRIVERWQNRAVGAVLMMSLLGSVIGSSLVALLVKASP